LFADENYSKKAMHHVLVIMYSFPDLDDFSLDPDQDPAQYRKFFTDVLHRRFSQKGALKSYNKQNVFQSKQRLLYNISYASSSV
jgi:hypothetical protein